MGRSCSRVSLLACLQHKMSTQRRSPPPPRVHTYGGTGRDQKPRGKIRAGRHPPHHCTRIDHCCRRRPFPSPPPLGCNPYLLKVTRVDTHRPWPTSAWGSTQPTFIKVPRCRWIKSFWIRYNSCPTLSGRIQVFQVSPPPTHAYYLPIPLCSVSL